MKRKTGTQIGLQYGIPYKVKPYGVTRKEYKNYGNVGRKLARYYHLQVES